MLVKTHKIKTEYNRLSKNKKSHAYTRYRTMVVLCCDCCDTTFERAKGSMDPKKELATTILMSVISVIQKNLHKKLV